MWPGDTPSLIPLPGQITLLYGYYNFVIHRAQGVVEADVKGEVVMK
jgi:hypothetical protein